MGNRPDPDRTTKLPPDPASADAAWTDSQSVPTPAAGGSTFVVGEVVADRYEVVRSLGRGAMGEVYEVVDRELREHVALKTILPDVAADPLAVERFRREIHLARRITHPNVCRLFDLGRHRLCRDGQPDRDVLFLTMELLAGETLRDRLKRCGKLSLEEALPLVEQMAAALGAAHAKDIVHRDFKSGNVLIVPAKHGDRAVVTDFGLARSLESAGSAAGLTVSGEVLGTPDYMAPEQVLGKEVGAAADLYALGVVMYEMVTGDLPFRAATPMAAALRRVQEPAPALRMALPGVDRSWQAAILRCLERAPEDRYTSAADVVRSLSGGRVSPGPRARRRVATAAAALVVAVVAIIAGWQLWRRSPTAADRSRSSPSVSTVAPRAALAVLGFKNEGSSDRAWMTTAISEMLRTELAAGGKLRSIPAESVARVRLELGLAEADSLAADTLGRIRSLLGADYVLLGSLLTQPQVSPARIRLDSRVQETRRGELLVQVPETGTEEELFELVARVGKRLRAELDLEQLPAELAAGIRAAMPESPEAARLYSEGLERLRLLDALNARNLLEKAAAVEPAHPMIRSALAAALAALGYEVAAQKEARLAFDHSRDLPLEERLDVAGRYHELHGEWDRAIAVYKRLAAASPDSVDHGLRLAVVQVSAGRPNDALTTLASLRRLPSPAGEDPRVDLGEAAAAKALTDFERQRRAAMQAAERSRALGAHLLFAQARQSECDALVNLERMVEGRESCQEAKTIFSATGDGDGVARTENIVAVSHAREGALDEAAAGFRRALEAFRRIGNRRGVATQLNNLGNVLSFQGDLPGARRYYEEARATFDAIGRRLDAARAANNLAAVLWDLKDLDGALATSRQVLPVVREAGASQDLAKTLFNIGEVLHAQGRLETARESYGEALALFRAAKATSDVADTLLGLGKVVADEGDRQRAGTLLEEARALFQADENEEGAAAAKAALAALDGARGS